MNPALLQKGSNSFRTDSEIKDHEGYDHLNQIFRLLALCILGNFYAFLADC